MVSLVVVLDKGSGPAGVTVPTAHVGDGLCVLEVGVLRLEDAVQKLRGGGVYEEHKTKGRTRLELVVEWRGGALRAGRRSVGRTAIRVVYYMLRVDLFFTKCYERNRMVGKAALR